MDIDHQAVEVTKLSLLLKVLEGENEQTLNRQLMLFQERVLPDLHNNIKCGNSLIGPDFYHGKQMTLLNEDEMFRINVFDWEAEFTEIMENGGFDAVLGNPPWGAELKENELIYLKKKHKEIIVRMIDSYMYFVHKSSLLLNNGKFGMIIPSTLLTQADMKALRYYLCDNFNLETVINLGPKVLAQKFLILLQY